MKTSFQRNGWPVVLGLLLLGLVPTIAGMIRLTDLASGAVTPDTARFFADPMPIVLHVTGSLVFALLGAFQFAPVLRRRWPGLHRIGGQVVGVAGFFSALTGVYMALHYDLPVNDSAALNTIRIVLGITMTGMLIIGIASARTGDFATHRAYMIRAYAIGLGASTQVLTHLPYFALVGAPDETARTVLMVAGWAINIVFAELVVRRVKLGIRMPQMPGRQPA